ncbi:MAG: carbohydrate binding domain-containing protein, partial [Polyangiales bacterium]
HFNGTDLVETIVFQEVNPIPGSYIGQTLEFTFDAKRGNINDPNAEACQPPPPPGGELTVNGDFETGDFTGWTNFCDNGAGSCTITSDNPNNGQFAANVSQPTLQQNAVIKQERIAAGEVATGDTILVELSIRGSVGPGGVVFLELFSEETGGGVTNEGLRGPFFPTADWVQISESFTLAGSPDDGITVQVAAVTSGDAGSFVDLFVDDVSAVKQ